MSELGMLKIPSNPPILYILNYYGFNSAYVMVVLVHTLLS